MRLLRIAALIGAVASGIAGVAGTASASPLAAGPVSAIQAENPLLTQVWHRGQPHYGPRRHYGPRAYRPYRPAYGRYGYRPRPRVVCRVRHRTVRTAYGLIRRPVEVCTRRW